MTRGIKPLNACQLNTHRVSHWQVFSCLSIQSPLLQRQECQRPLSCVWSVTSILYPHACHRWGTWAWHRQREGTSRKDQSQETERSSKAWNCTQERCMALTHRGPYCDLRSWERGLRNSQNQHEHQGHLLLNPVCVGSVFKVWMSLFMIVFPNPSKQCFLFWLWFTAMTTSIVFYLIHLGNCQISLFWTRFWIRFCTKLCIFRNLLTKKNCLKAKIKSFIDKGDER